MAQAPLSLPDALDRALACHRAGDLGEAERRYRAILAASPDHGDALHLLGVIAHQGGRSETALGLVDRAIAVGTESAEVWSNRGLVLQALRRPEEALASFARAASLQPNLAEHHFNCGNMLQLLQHAEAALDSYARALALRPDHAEALSNRGLTLHHLQRFEAALESYDQALALRPDFADALSNRGNTLHELRRFEEALASYDAVLALRSDHAETHYDRANALKALGRFEEALAGYDRAVALRPSHAEALNNRGNTLHALHRFDAALASYAQAEAIDPNLADAHFNEALCRLLYGDFARGWSKYEWRRKIDYLAPTGRSFSPPLWLGKEDIAGKTILLHAEQGFGDTIQFCRYVPLVAATGATMILEVQAPLLPLLRNLAGIAQLKARSDDLPDFDFHCPLLSLPLAFGTQIETIPAPLPYLHATADRIDKMAALLPTASFRVGLVWSGRPTHLNDRNRSIALERLDPLLGLAGIGYVSLQRDLRLEDAAALTRRPALMPLGDHLGDFADTAAVLAALDLVITVDTAVAHLAGAMGKQVWILLPYVPDWRWLLDREDSPWYPSARLFRQPAPGDWDQVIARVAAELSRLAATPKGKAERDGI